MLDKFKTADVRNIIAFLVAVLFCVLSIMGRISEEQTMAVIIMVFTFLFVRATDKKK